jgi:hypothetical protein
LVLFHLHIISVHFPSTIISKHDSPTIHTKNKQPNAKPKQQPTCLSVCLSVSSPHCRPTVRSQPEPPTALGFPRGAPSATHFDDQMSKLRHLAPACRKPPPPRRKQRPCILQFWSSCGGGEIQNASNNKHRYHDTPTPQPTATPNTPAPQCANTPMQRLIFASETHLRATHICDTHLRAKRICERNLFATETHLRAKRICERNAFASETKLRAKPICERNTFANEAHLRAKRSCERRLFASDTHLRANLFASAAKHL